MGFPLRIHGLKNLVLVRHGQSVRNLAEGKGAFFENDEERERYGNCADHLIPLTPKGTKQARALGRGLRKNFGAFDYVFHSGYVRSLQTMNAALRAYTKEERGAMPIDENLLLCERDGGHLLNFTKDEVREFFPWWGSHYMMTRDPLLMRPLGGEQMIWVAEIRLRLFFAQMSEFLPRTSGGASVWINSHGRAILASRYLLEQWSHDRMNDEMKYRNPPNCSVAWYTFDSCGKAQLQFANKVYRK